MMLLFALGSVNMVSGQALGEEKHVTVEENHEKKLKTVKIKHACTHEEIQFFSVMAPSQTDTLPV